MNAVSVAAVDLGAASGRVILGRVAPDRLDVREVARFVNLPVRLTDATGGTTLHWNIVRLYQEMLSGLRAAGVAADRLDSVGVDSWAVDYGLLDADGRLLGDPVHYRDARTDGVMARTLDRVPAEEIYAVTGIQFLPFNTAYQLVADAGTARFAAARLALLIPDLLSFWLTGRIGAEITNASTTQLLDVHSGTWSGGLVRRLGLDPALLPPLRRPGEPIGDLLPHVLAECGLTGPVRCTAIGSHDTASAVVGVPATGSRFAYVSCGTWSLVGVELAQPVLSEASRTANFTNEAGVDGTIRYLRNVMGLWLLQESMRTWGRTDVEGLVAEAARVPAFTAVVDPGDPAFLPPGDLPARIAKACERTGQRAPAGPAETVRCILDSLALGHRRAVRDALRLSGVDADVVHIVGGGARNELLCQLTADACDLPVAAGPVEATALGNVLVQARALDAAGPELADLRALLRATQPVRWYRPSGDQRAWDEAADRLGWPRLT